MNLTPCDNCPATCCRKYSVGITIPDAWRVSQGLHLGVADFAELLWLEEPEEDRRIVLAPDNGRYYRFRLKSVPDGEDHRCVFLLSITEERSFCSIYEFRPEVCRTYPTYLEAGGVMASSGGKYCPPGAWSIEKMNTRQKRVEWALRNRFRMLHDELVDGWNERVFYQNEKMTKGDFHGFISSTCSELEALSPDIFQRPKVGTPFHDPGDPKETLAELCDQVLRSIGWRTDETIKHARPNLGRKPEKVSVAVPITEQGEKKDGEARHQNGEAVAHNSGSHDREGVGGLVTALKPSDEF